MSQAGDVKVSLVNTEPQVPGQEDLPSGEDGVASPPDHHPALALWNSNISSGLSSSVSTINKGRLSVKMKIDFYKIIQPDSAVSAKKPPKKNICFIVLLN